MNMKRLLHEYNIPFDEAGTKNVGIGFIGLQCPYCDDTSNHLGWNLDDNYFKCWRCGWHTTVDTLMQLLRVSETEIHTILAHYDQTYHPQRPTITRRPHIKSFTVPSNCDALQSHHQHYLKRRQFDPDHLTSLWNIQATGPVSFLDGKDYKNRIIAPITWNGNIVSFQSRSISEKDPKYKACPQDREERHHKHILYGRQENWGKTGICVEGIFDVWRLGPSSFATFGIEYTKQQVKEMVAHFDRIAVIFDSESQAISQANKLVSELLFAGIDAWSITLKSDPAELSQADADHLVKKIIT